MQNLVKPYILYVLFFIYSGLFSQEIETFEVRTVAFYNLENLFDTENDTLIFDDDRTPTGKDNWTEERYWHKIEQLSTVLLELGATSKTSNPDILGVCEVENLKVLKDLIHHKNLQSFNYGIIHFNSPDERGIDVALLYKKEVFIPVNFNSHRLLLFNDDGERNYTRDQLIVEGLLDNEKIYFLVNHWPSRSGGEARSRPFRLEAAKLNKRILDSVKRQDINAKIVSMGDFNDDPTNESFKKVLKVEGSLNKLDSTGLYGPMEKIFRKGKGSLAYRDKWNLFDQFYMTANLITVKHESYRYWKSGVFTPDYLIDPKGKYKGYPLRTYAGGSYIGGYSDHFPIYLYLIRKTGL